MLCLSVLAGASARAQGPGNYGTVQLRIVERTGQSEVTPADNVLDFAVQAKGLGQSVAGCWFNIHIVGEPESFGTLARGTISNADGTYSQSLGVTSAMGRGGLAAQYTFFGQINASFNGVINQNTNTFTNGPDQEIFLVAAYSASSSLLQIPGMDSDGDGNPDTWSGNGTGATPPDSARAPIDPAIAGPYLGYNQFVDVYHFRYTVSSMSPRILHLAIESASATVADELIYNRSWGTAQDTDAHFPTATTTVQPFDIGVMQSIPEPGFGAGVLVAFATVGRRRREVVGRVRGRGATPTPEAAW